MLKAYELIKKGIQAELEKIEAEILVEFLKKNKLELKVYSMDSIYYKSKDLQKALIEHGYDLQVKKYEGGHLDGEEHLELISWEKAEEGRLGVITYKTYAPKTDGTGYKELPETKQKKGKQ